ncbi:MAG TPA: alpha/beta fold hydrolase [Ferruginibacter sp.]|nr:alpha/beta hydrolase [Chitinophagaceae bacterium]HML57078.1 alpha/beta fold hydrolase [Ferruginibacter sp.]HRN91556.1 alpha/beta fold hydrolase [Ferruginibacter sp.]HRO05102.1 alpha/beta fold hydrolase [Ferruginibacter sp.]HRO95593.1 alpha/beta fold hydrolase [Ferruginibacter sp.]
MNSTLLYIIGGYLLLLALVYLLQERFIFKPEKLHQGFQYKFDVPFRELFFDVEPNVRINGLHFTVKNPLGLVLYFHGNSRSIKGWSRYAKDFYRYNYDVVLVDYRGFGKSTGKRSEKMMLKDMQFVYDTLAVQYHEHHIIVYGRSLGSGFAAKIASDNKPRYLILDSPYYNFKKVVERFLPFLPLRILLRFHLRTDKWIKHVNCHTYIIHGTKDWLIPISNSENLQALNPKKITLVRIEGGGHNNLPSFPAYHNIIRDILQY